MADFCCPFRTAEDKVIILRSVKFMAKSADLCRKLMAHHKQMADIIDAAEQINIKVWFEMGIEERPPVHVQLIFI